MTRRFFAHSLEGRPTEDWQPVRDHLENVAGRAGEFAKAFGGEQWAFLAGLWHDIGKYSEAFQRRIGAAGDGDAHIEEAGRPDHSTAGARHAVSVSSNGGKILAYLIAGHHAGLPDGVSDGGACLARRLKKDVPIPPRCPSDHGDRAGDRPPVGRTPFPVHAFLNSETVSHNAVRTASTGGPLIDVTFLGLLITAEAVNSGTSIFIF